MNLLESDTLLTRIAENTHRLDGDGYGVETDTDTTLQGNLSFHFVGWDGGHNSEPHSPIVAVRNEEGDELMTFVMIVR